MILTAPYWLFAASAILIPIAIHLWNKRQGKTVKVGSLRWMEPSASTRWSSIKLNNLLLLLLRCLILLLLALALAQPTLVHRPKQQGQKAVYVGQELLYTSARASIQPMVDSLLQRGYMLYAYTADFQQIQQQEWEQLSGSTTDSTFSNHSNYWSLLPALADRYNKPQDSIWLFTSDQQRYFTGNSPAALPGNIHWVPIATENNISWLQAVIKTAPDSLLLLVGHSTRDDLSYSRYSISDSSPRVNLPKNQTLQLQKQGDSLQWNIGSLSSKIKVQAEPLKIAILAGEAEQGEQRYLQAALQAISSYTGLPISLQQDPDNSDWVFWLQEEELPQNIKQRVPQGQLVWVQHKQKPFIQKAYMATAAGPQVEVRQLSTGAMDTNAETLWTTSSGEALLTTQQVGKGRLYAFRSGFETAWSELGQGGALPELLLPLLLPQQEANQYDVRALDEGQLMPDARTEVTEAAAPEAQREPLLKWVVLLAFILFAVERYIAGRRSKV